MQKQGAGEDKPRQKSPIAAREEEILGFWQERDIFKKTLEKPAPKGDFVFYEGPPTANGRPGIHHLESRAFKDAIPRYRTMRGYRVRRKAGWDTHGLPVELEVEKELGTKNKKDIEAYGVAAFNKKCKESVLRYIDEWRRFTDRIAFWVDHNDTYFTFDNSYIESVWNILKKTEERGLLYKDFKVVPWCPRCGTALSSHEVAQGYAEVKDPSVYVKFKLADADEYFLAWTTTPWTLPGNVALAVGADIEYVKVETAAGALWLAEARKEAVVPEAQVLARAKGKELVGKAYEPLYPYLADSLSPKEKEKLPNAYKVYAADFVSTQDGTGIVHTAVMYGADDFELGTKVGLPKQHVVGEDGKFLPVAGELAGLFFKKADELVIEDLEKRGLLLKKETTEHTYPFCWRCKTPLIYYARDSWYIRMSQLKRELIRENESINWEPAHIRDGRFGEWLRELKDWAISRSRFWGTPLPIWQTEDGHERAVVGSIEELKRRAKKSGNRYFAMRHGEAEHNIPHILDNREPDKYALTERGREQVKAAGEKLRSEGITRIVASPFLRTRQTAELMAETLGLPASTITLDERLREFDFGDLNNVTREEYFAYRDKLASFTEKFPNGESYMDAKRRFGECLYDIDARYANETILLVTHGIGLEVLPAVAAGANVEEYRRIVEVHKPEVAEVQQIDFAPLPHNEDYELDLHRPYTDDIVLLSDSGREMRRVPEVLDVWFDSGAMPFAQDHYPFEHRQWVDGKGYPADYISEAIDQTRGWFYTLHAVGALMGRGKAYRNVVCLGHVLDARGKKMSKSVGNVVEPFSMIEKYGVDALRYFMYAVNAPGDSKNFDERAVDEIVKKHFGRLDNVLAFYKLYADPDGKAPPSNGAGGTPQHTDSSHVLDRWILARLEELVEETTAGYEAYKLDAAVRPLGLFIDDLSTWYVRRSRDRFKAEGPDKRAATATLRQALHTLALLMAPATPFFAEYVYGEVREESEPESVHLARWPKEEAWSAGGWIASLRNLFGASAPSEKSEALPLLAQMAQVRSFASQALKEREQAGIRIRQPLGRLRVRATLPEELKIILAAEVNVRDIVTEPALETDTELDTTLTPDLEEEGKYRDWVRAIQGWRKEAGLTLADRPGLLIHTSADAALLRKYRDLLAAETGLLSLEIKESGDEKPRFERL